MRQHAAKWVILGLLAVVVGLPFVLRLGTPKVEAAGGGERLIVYTPHNDAIRFEMARGFNLWRAAQGLEPVAFDWRTGGTSDLRRQVFDQFAQLVGEGRADEGIGVDLFFGGGEYDHDRLASGISRADGQAVPLTVTAQIPDPLYEAAFPQPTIGGERLNHEQQRWTGVVLSSFGIVYNRPYLDAIGVPEPRTWSDLTTPQLFGTVALADPAHSGSITAAYHALMRRTGWTEGWAMLRRIFANARYFTAGASQVPIDVASGEAAAGMCIDFYGRYQAGSVGDERVGYVDPPFMTAITADTLSILRGAPHMATAQQFVTWMVTKDAQRLWQRRRGAPGGPATYELRRQPIRADLYTPDEQAHWTDPQIDPFHSTRPMPEAMPAFFNTIAPIAHAMAIDIHGDLKAAWSAILRTPMDDPKRPAMLEAFDAMPPELTLVWPEGLDSQWQAAIDDPDHPRHEEAARVLGAFVDGVLARWDDPDQRDRDRLAWTLFFRQQYRKVAAMTP